MRPPIRAFSSGRDADAAAVARARELASQILESDRLPVQVRMSDADVGAFFVLASGTDPKIAAAGLDALTETFNAVVQVGRGPELQELVSFRLAEGSALIRARALGAAAPALLGRRTSKALLEKVSQILIVERNPALVHAALLALRAASFDVPAPELVSRLLSLSSDDAPQHRAAALQVLARVARATQPRPIVDRGLASIADSDAVVRASAAQLLGSLATNSEESFTALVKATSDAEACVRGAAARALGGTPNTRGIAVLMRLLDDRALSTCELKGFPTADRSLGRLSVEGLGEEVRVLALDGIERLATPAGHSLELGRNQSPASVDRNVKLVKEWYKRADTALAKPPSDVSQK